jgi:small subunit ribosomal protein S4
MLNGRRVDIPSIRVSEGDEIVVRPKSADNEYFKQLADISATSSQPSLGWIKSDVKKKTIQITGVPSREEAEPEINEQLIVEFYSR